MGVLTDQREALASDLEATGLRVFPAWPSRLDPPCIVLVPGFPWVDATGITFGERRAHLSVHIIAGPGNIETALGVLEIAVESVLTYSADWAVESVDAPSLVSVNGAEYLATTLNITKPFRLTNP